jgi:regulator of sigma E protease
MALALIVTIIAFGVMVILHEAGHFFTAKLFSVTVHEFSVGMGPLLASLKKGGTQYSLRALPLGGYVKLEGEDDESDDPKAFSNISPLKRIVILAAGAFMNVLLGFLCFVIILSASSGVYSNTVASVTEGSAAQMCGILPGDKITKIDSMSIGGRADIMLALSEAGDKVSVTVKRNGQKIKFIASPTDESGRKVLGVVPTVESITPVTVLKNACYNTRYVVRLVFYSLKMLFTGKAGIRDLSGPVGIVKVADQAASEAKETGGSVWITLLSLFAMISVNLGVFNLLPFPALDGGSIIFAFVQLFSRKKLSQNVLGYINFAGLVIILGLGIIVMGSDVLHLFGK